MTQVKILPDKEFKNTGNTNVNWIRESNWYKQWHFDKKLESIKKDPVRNKDFDSWNKNTLLIKTWIEN